MKMNRIHFAIVMSSPAYRDLIYASLQTAEIIMSEPVKDEEKYLLDYVTKNAAEISNYDAFIIDLGALKDTDEQILEAVEAIRYLDDKIRIVILESTRQNSYKLLHDCFLNGVYNLIEADNFIRTKEKLEKALENGISYKDVLSFKEETRRITKPEERREVYSKRKIAFLGTQERIGTTHCVLTAAYTLKSQGYLVAVVDNTEKDDYLNLMYGYEETLDENNMFSVEDIDFYLLTDVINKTYNFILYDCGCIQPDAEVAEEIIMITGSKTWELPFLSGALSRLGEAVTKVKYLFNFTIPEMQDDLRKLMKDMQIEEKQVFFMEYTADFFSDCEVMKNLLAIEPKEEKKNWFSKMKKKKRC